ncbi:hypothetical protein [Haloarchaeobius litoreus]|uniref:DUF6788 domain-containing protein n=1 Tax=Haloarchaeobius litoreus TaxID=755306 RepID=A0ABD6DNV4_9EURY|nr:hypothetical protein [Haloarchaeobius litoreus]
MPFEPPTPPPELSTDLVESLADCSPDQLREAANYAFALASHRERDARLDEGENDDQPRPDSRPAEVPAKASLTTKTINDNRYYYWQWREGDRVKSKYHSPVDETN